MVGFFANRFVRFAHTVSKIDPRKTWIKSSDVMGDISVGSVKKVDHRISIGSPGNDCPILKFSTVTDFRITIIFSQKMSIKK